LHQDGTRSYSTQLDRLEAAQTRTEQNLNRLDQKFESFLAEWSRIHAHDAEPLARMEAGIDANRAAIERLTRNTETDRLENRISRDRINVLIERVEALLNG
jgi:hypothetical protein